VDQTARFKTVLAHSAYKPKWILRKKDLVVWWLEEATLSTETYSVWQAILTLIP